MLSFFCGKQNISLRGHRNEDWRPGSDEKPDGNPGNFLALLHFRSEAGDASVSRPFHVIGGAGRPVLYTSPEIRNELIACCGDVMREELLRTMGQERLSGLALLHTHYGTELDRNKVLHAFVRKNRRILLPKSFL